MPARPQHRRFGIDVGRRLTMAMSFLSNLAVLIGIPLFFYQQHAESERNRANATLTFVARFQDSDFAARRFALLRPWLEYGSQIQALNTSNAPSAVVEKLIIDIVEANSEALGTSELSQALVEVEYFFNGLSLCVGSGSCSRELADAYFGPFARDFHCLYEPVLERYRDRLALHDFGKSVQVFAGGEAACSR
jgi:hypothetical protein